MTRETLHKQLLSILPGDPSADSVRFISNVLLNELSGSVGSLKPGVTLPGLSAQEQTTLKKWLDELSTGKPLQYVLGKAWFMDFELQVNEEVLIPRPETEELVELIIASETDVTKVLDLGTGSGCIALGLKRRFPGAKVIATDISEQALKIAHSNAARLEIGIDFVQHDMLSGVSEILPENLDILVSNPPYVLESESHSMLPGVKDFEPAIALYTPDNDPLKFYKAIMDIAFKCLKPGRKVYLEVNQLYANATAGLFEANGFLKTSVLSDISGNPRFVITTKC